MIRTIAAASVLTAGLALGLGSLPAQAQVSTTVASAAESGQYAVEPYHTRIVFAVSHMGFTTWYGDFTGASGSLTFDAKAPAKSSLSISIPTGSVATTNAKLDGELKSATWFDATQYPTITFQATGIKVTGKSTGHITGNLTFHGVTKAVTLLAHFNGAGTNPLDHKYTIGFNATTLIKRSEFGVKTYVPVVGDEVTVTISAAFEKQG